MAQRRSFGSITKRGKNVYRLQWSGRDGARHSETVHDTRYGAEMRLLEIEQGARATSRSVTFSVFWRDTVQPSFDGLSVLTVEGYERLWKRELEQRIGSIKVASLDWRDVQRVIDEIQAPSTQRHVFSLLRKICNMAIREHVMTYNPCDRSIRMRQHVKQEKRLVEAEEVAGLLDAIYGTKYEPIVLCTLGGGLRPEEAYALEWSDIEPYELKGSTYALVSVTKTLVTARGGSISQDRTKTAMSNRSVLIGAPFAARLLELKGDGPLVANDMGKHSAPVTIAHNWRLWCDRRGLPHYTIENMRSSFATLHGTAGSPDSMVSFAMGHADGTTKGTHYQRATLRGLAFIADNLADMLAECDEEELTK